MSTIHSFIAASKHQLKQFSLTTPVAIILASVILGGSHVVYGLVSSGTAKATVNMFLGKPVDSSDYVEGNAKSKVIVVEYSDPECPYCVSLHPTLKKLRDDYKDKVAFVYRHFPLTQIHPHARDESKAIICAGELGGTNAFYEYVDALYGYKSENQTTQLPTTGKEDIASNIGLDKADFLSCMKKEDTGGVVDASINDGVQAGVQGTPTTFVLIETKKGYEIVAALDGARPYEYMQAAFEEALAR
jgi:protein-disulfide isomerase